jgi:hypothetical protein
MSSQCRRCASSAQGRSSPHGRTAADEGPSPVRNPATGGTSVRLGHGSRPASAQAGRDSLAMSEPMVAGRRRSLLMARTGPMCSDRGVRFRRRVKQSLTTPRLRRCEQPRQLANPARLQLVLLLLRGTQRRSRGRGRSRRVSDWWPGEVHDTPPRLDPSSSAPT